VTKSELALPTPATVQKNWLTGNWSGVLELDPATVRDKRGRGRCLLLQASAHLQLGQHEQARAQLLEALDCGCDGETAARILAAGLHHTMARMELLRKRSAAAAEHFKAANELVGSAPLTETAVQAKTVVELINLELLPDAAALIEDGVERMESSVQRPSEKRAQAAVFASEIELLNQQIAMMQQRQQLYPPQQPGTNATADDPSDREHLRRLSVSQLGQDLWVLEQTGYKREGYFIEFGATDGVRLNNTYLLEKHFGWSGICAEPNPKFFDQLQRNRSCIVAQDCISGESGRKVQFVLADEFGGIAEYKDVDLHGNRRMAYMEQGNVIDLTTISLNDFLEKYDAPTCIDYLSVDTEGNELEILAGLDFDKWDIRFITVEHNHTDKREEIYALLSGHGYERTEADWDDWYAKS